jgi:hypothetical protein
MSNATTAPHKLNLDELFGQARAVEVIYEGETYELLRLEGIDPKRLTQFQKLQKRASALQRAGEGMTDKQSEDVEALFDDMLAILCKDLPLATMPFIKKMRIITFYIEETQGKKALETALNKVTGAKRSRA